MLSHSFYPFLFMNHDCDPKTKVRIYPFRETHSVLAFLEGVVISMVSQKNGDGYALLLDGSTFEEIARARFPYGLPYGLHGCWVPKNQN